MARSVRSSSSLAADPLFSVPWALPTFTSGTLTWLKWFALALMTLDHVDAFAFDRELIWACQLGRLVFPIFAAIIAINLARPGALASGVHRRMLQRLLIFGLLATPFHAALASHALGWWPLNVLATFAVFVAVAWLIELRQPAAAVLVFLLGGALVEYAWPGVGLCLAIWHLYRRPGLLALGLVGWAWASLQLINGSWAALWALPILLLASQLRLQAPRSRWAFYVYYPAHLAAFWLLLRAW